MARRTGRQTFEMKVEKALEKAMDFDFSKAGIEGMSSDTSANPVDPVDVDDLIKKIASAEENATTEDDTSSLPPSIHDGAAIDESVAEQLFGQKPTDELAGGTVQNTLLSEQPLPANDDSIIPLNFTSSRQNSISRTYWNTTALSALWAAGGAFIAHKLAPSGLNSLESVVNFITSPIGLAVAAGTAIPIMMSWGFAKLIKHSKELHNIVMLMTNAAQHLNEPREISEKQIAIIGKTIREEIATMNEEIERTLKRAVELEAIIQGEVRTLEQAYGRNKSRIHTLIKELSNERMAILNHASRVQSAIKGTQQQLSGEFDSVTSQIAKNVENFAQILSQTLQKQGEDLVAKLSYAGDGVTNKLFEKFNETTLQIQHKNTKLFHELGKNFDNFSERFDDNERRLENIFNETATKAEICIAKVATHIQDVTDDTLLKVDKKFKVLDKTIIDRHDESLQNFDEKILHLNEKAGKLSSQFDDITSEAIEAFEDRLVAVDLSLKEHSDSVVETFVAHSQELENNVEKLGSFLEAHASQIHAGLKQKTSDIADVFTSGHDNIRLAVDESKKSLREEIRNIDTAIIDIIKERSQDLQLQFSDQRDIMSDMINREKDKIANTLKDQIDSLAQNISAIEKTLIDNVQTVDLHTADQVANIVHCTEKLQESIAQSCEKTQEALEVQARNIDVRTDALRDSLAMNSVSLNEVLSGQTHVLEKRMEEIHDLIAKSDIHIDVALKQQVNLVEDAIADNNKVLVETVQNHIKELGDRTEILKDTLYHSNGEFFEAFGTHIELFDKDLESRAHQICEHADMLTEKLAQKFNQVHETIDMQTSALEERSDALKTSIIINNEQNREIQHALETSVDNIRTTLESSISAITDNLQDTITQASGIFYSTGEQILASLHGETDKAQEKLFIVSEQLASIVAEQVERSETSILSAGDKFISSVSDITVKAENIILESGDRIVSNVEQTVHETSQKLLSSLTEQTAYTTEAFTVASNNVHTLLNEAVNTSTTAIEQLLHERSSALYHSMQELESNLGYQLSDVSSRLEETSNQTALQISGHVEQLTELSDHLNQVAQHTAESLSNLTQHVSEQISFSTEEVEKRIHAQNQSLVDTLTQANFETIQTVNTVKEDLVGNVSSILEQLNQSIYNIHENSNALVSTIQSVDGQFNETANNFFHNTSKTAEYFSNSSQELNSTVEILQEFVQGTFNKMSNITENFGSHTQALSETINALQESESELSGAFKKKQNVLYELGDLLVSKFDEFSKLIQHYENALNSAFERTDKNARNSEKSLQQTLNKLVYEASTRFSESAEDIHNSVNEVRLELSKISNNVNESIQQLPEKAQETIDAIHLALEEKISVLKDLANVVQNNNKKERLIPKVLESLAPSKKNSVFPDIVKKATLPKSVVQTEQNNKNQNKWVSNLLERASHEERNDESTATATASQVQTKPQLMKESLNLLAANILKAINHDAVVGLWRHYKRGQKNITVERLYTASGQMIFEKIKKKYVKDSDFKRVVDRYIADFERLLRDASRSSGTAGAAQKHLVSNAGKVYTILSHASGRIQ